VAKVQMPPLMKIISATITDLTILSTGEPLLNSKKPTEPAVNILEFFFFLLFEIPYTFSKKKCLQTL